VRTESYANIWKVSMPLILGSLAHTIISVTDTAFMGRIGDVELGAVGIGGIFIHVFTMAAVGLAIGAQIIIARLHGKNEVGTIGHVFQDSLIMMAIAAIGTMLLTWATSSWFVHTFLQSPAIAASTLDYLNVRVWGFLPGFLFIGIKATFMGASYTKPVAYTSAWMAVINLFLNWVLVFGKLGAPEMGLQGAALASVISEATTVFIAWYFVKGKGFAAYNLLEGWAIRWDGIKRIVKLSLPMVFQFTISVTSWFTFFILIEGMGERSLAISNLSRSVYGIFMVPNLGLGQAVNTLVSKLIGEGKEDQVNTTIKRTMLFAVVSSLAIVAVNYIVPEFSLSIFTDDSLLIRECLPVIDVISFAMFFFAIAIVAISALAGTGNTKISMFIEIAVLVLYLIFIYMAVHQWHWSLRMVWTAEIFYWGALGSFTLAYLWTGKWKGKEI
jgi:putative MATE family efflux protein